MNKELLDKLKFQAAAQVSPLLEGSEWQQVYSEKFAELIVKECAQAFEAEVDTWKEMDPYQGSIKRQGTKAIKQHFGVEK